MSLNKATKRQRIATNVILVNVSSVKLKAEFRFNDSKVSRNYSVGFVDILRSTVNIFVRYLNFYIIGVRCELLGRINYWSISVASSGKDTAREFVNKERCF